MEFKDKILLHCFREVKCQQDFTTEVIYYLDYSSWTQTDGLMDSMSKFKSGGLGSFPERGEYEFAFQ